jgi:anti-sigma regulatory factor (Ser/Thr protein kinase)
MQHGPALISGSPERRSGSRPEPPPKPAAGAGRRPDSAIRLTLPAHAKNVVLVRHVVAALAEGLDLPARLIEDVKLAVTEACTNVVRHAYAGSHGTLDVAVEPGEDMLTVIVTDHGHGLRPNPVAGGAGLGLPLMGALAHALEIEQSPDRGARVRMSFRRGR